MTRRRRQLLNTAEDPREGHDLDNVARFEPRRETVGDLLRRTRETKGHELDAVATRLRIRPAYLKAIESGRFHDLPGSTYAVGFVRTYADYLGLDSEDVVRRFRDEVAEVNNQTQLIFPAVAAEGKIPRGAILLLSALLGAIAYGGWYYLSEREQNPLDLIPELPGQLRALVTGEGAPSGDGPSGAGSFGDTATAPPPVSQSAPSASPSTGAAPAEAVAPAVAPDVAEAMPAEQPAPMPAEQPGEADADALSAASASAMSSPQVPPVTELPPTEDADALEAARLSAAVPNESAAAASADVAPPSAAPSAIPAPEPSVAVPELPSVAAPTLDSSGLPTVAAPTAPAIGGTGPQVSPDGAALPAAAEGQVYGAVDAPSRIVLVARLESWVRITDPETNELLTRVLRVGDRYYVPDQPGLTLATGNAGGLDVWVDGRKLPALGPVGVVRRDIALDPQRLKDGTAASGAAAAE